MGSFSLRSNAVYISLSVCCCSQQPAWILRRKRTRPRMTTSFGAGVLNEITRHFFHRHRPHRVQPLPPGRAGAETRQRRRQKERRGGSVCRQQEKGCHRGEERGAQKGTREEARAER